MYNNILCSDTTDIASTLGAFFSVLIFVIIAVLLVRFVCYLIKAFTVYKLAKMSNQKWCWWAFIPILQDAKVYRLAGFTEKFFGVSFLVCAVSGLVPIPYFAAIVAVTHIVLTYYIRWRVAANFGCGTFGCILNMFFEPFVLIYLALSDRAFVSHPMNRHIADFLRDMGLDDDDASCRNGTSQNDDNWYKKPSSFSQPVQSAEKPAETHPTDGFNGQYQPCNEQQTPTADIVDTEIVE